MLDRLGANLFGQHASLGPYMTWEGRAMSSCPVIQLIPAFSLVVSHALVQIVHKSDRMWCPGSGLIELQRACDSLI